MTIFRYATSMETVVEEHPDVEVTSSGWYRLSPGGLWAGEGDYETGVEDLGTLFTFTGISWTSTEEFSTSVDTIPGSPKTISVRYSAYNAPVLNNSKLTWNNLDNPNPDDINWGTSGSIPWVELENNVPVTGVLVRYIQWKAKLKGA